MQTRDEIRTQVQEQVREAVREATNAARDAARDAAEIAQAPVLTPIDGNLMLDVLRGEISAARDEVASLTARLGSGGRRQQAAIEEQLARANGRLEHLQERLDAVVSGAPAEVFTEVPAGLPPGLDGERIERMARMATEGFYITVVALVIGIPLVRAFSRWVDRRAAPAAVAADTGPRLDRMEQALDSIAVEVERVAEGQRYATRLLGELKALPAPDPQAQWSVQQREPERVRHTTPA